MYIQWFKLLARHVLSCNSWKYVDLTYLFINENQSKFNVICLSRLIELIERPLWPIKKHSDYIMAPFESFLTSCIKLKVHVFLQPLICLPYFYIISYCGCIKIIRGLRFCASIQWPLILNKNATLTKSRIGTNLRIINCINIL